MEVKVMVIGTTKWLRLAIADYAGHECDKAMGELIINGNEILPKEPE